MTQRLRLAVITFFFLSSPFLFSGHSNADIIRLKDGRELRGKVIQETQDVVVIDFGFGRAGFNKSNIESIETETPEPVKRKAPLIRRKQVIKSVEVTEEEAKKEEEEKAKESPPITVYDEESIERIKEIRKKLVDRQGGVFPDTAQYLVGFIFLVPIILLLLFWIYYAICLQNIAKKIGKTHSWMAWIPILCIFLECRAAGKSIFWFLLYFIPLVNIVVYCFIWSNIAVNRGKPGWLWLFLLLPFGNVFVFGYLAFSK